MRGGELLNGRIDLGAGNPGLAFFPRTDITERGLVSFELLVDGAATRLPLIFVDNIAATTASSLGKLVELYGTTPNWISRRTLPMNGQKDSLRAGKPFRRHHACDRKHPGRRARPI